jgi:hypothetical protein
MNHHVSLIARSLSANSLMAAAELAGNAYIPQLSDRVPPENSYALTATGDSIVRLPAEYVQRVLDECFCDPIREGGPALTALLIGKKRVKAQVTF